MRQIGTIPDRGEAQKLADYLLTLGIATRLDQTSEGVHVWVIHEDKVPLAREELAAFQSNPADPKFTGRAGQAKIIRKEAQKRQREHEAKSIDVRYVWSPPDFRRCPVTYLLIGACVALFVISTYFDPEDRIRDALMFASYELLPASEAPADRPFPGVIKGNVWIKSDVRDDLARGQVWRLVTPIFLHGGPIHLVLNMMMLYQVAGMIELRRKSWRLIGLVIASAIASNTAQYLYTGSPLFVGISGVDLALFGYIWMKGIYEPRLGLGLHPSSVTNMVIFLVITILGPFGWIAHAAHLGGLAAGVLIGLGPHLLPFRLHESE